VSRKTIRVLLALFLFPVVLLALLAAARSPTSTAATTYRFNSTDNLEIINTRAQIVTYRGRRALHLAPPNANADPDHGSMIALVNNSGFKNGAIEAEVAGLPITLMDSTARGFVGIVFRAQPHAAKAENIYLRPTNGRADDQLRRNHSVQYESIPEFPWHRLRREQPGVYESYTDLDPGAWTKMKIEVHGTNARLYVNGATQPCLIVNDLKLGDSGGQIGLWAFIATDAYFSNLKITNAD
jgi:hypothetical protein